MEDKQVADRLIKILPNIVKLFKFWNGLPKSKQPKSKSYMNVKGVIGDVLYPAKLSFFQLCGWFDDSHFYYVIKLTIQ